MARHDLVIRGGTVVDGSGAEGFAADVAVTDGTITEVGRVDGAGAREIDAAGALVTPGFVDVHTHYDGQVSWSSTVDPSSWHGVTTVVMGNCGVGFAPVRPSDRQALIELMEGVEDIPGTALHSALTWEWESFPDYLDALGQRSFDVDIATQVPHGALRLHVMGERGANREPATADDIVVMARLAAEAVEAGAFGFTSSRTINHRTSRGEPTPTLTAERDELVAIAEAVGRAGGVLQLISDFDDLDAEFDLVVAMGDAAGQPVSFTLAQVDFRPDDWQRLLAAVESARARGSLVRPQVAPRSIGALLGLQASMNPFITHPAYREIADRPLAERVARLSDPAFRARLLGDDATARSEMARFLTGRFDKMYELGDPPDYEPSPDRSIAARAAREGRRPEEVALDVLVADGGRAFLYFPIQNYTAADLDNVRAMLAYEHSLVALGDGGAHVGAICDASFPTTLLSHWGRDRSRGEGFAVPWLVHKQTRKNALAMGLSDRGLVQPGMRADLNVIDFERLAARPPEMAFDLPDGSRRLVQRADGYLATLVHGTVTYEDGTHTGELPGRLLRRS